MRSDTAVLIERDIELISEAHPLFGIVWVNPARLSGAPCFHGTRVPVKNLFGYLKGGDGLELFLEDFEGVTREQAVRLLEMAEQAVLVGMRRLCLGLIFSLMLLCGSIFCLAQSQNPATSGKEERSTDDTLIACQFGEPITIEVWVRDRESKEVETLDKDNFFIVEDGVTQQIIFWLREETLENGILRFRYKIEYLPANETLDGQYRRVQVGVQTKNNARLNVYSWPRGYYAKREGTESSTNDANGKKKP